MTMIQYIAETEQLKAELTFSNPNVSKVIERLTELYKASLNEPWHDEYLKKFDPKYKNTSKTHQNAI